MKLYLIKWHVPCKGALPDIFETTRRFTKEKALAQIAIWKQYFTNNRYYIE